MSIEGKILFLVQLFIAPFIAFVLSLFLTGFSIKYLCRYGFSAQRGGRHIHKRVIPTAGGISFIAAFMLSALFFNLWVEFINKSPEVKYINFVFFLPMTVLFLLGIYDDRFGMKAIIKLIGQIAAASVAWFCNLRMSNLFGFELNEYASFAVTLFWFLLFINAFNLIDGLDGLASGLAVLAGLTMGMVLLIGHHWTEAVLALCVAAVSCGFLRYNFHPAKVFMGDTGSMFLGYILALIGLKTSNFNTSVYALAIPVMACGVPLIDTALAVWRRSTFKILKKQSWREILSADREHLHHRILDVYHGNQSRAAVIIYILALVMIGVGIIFSMLVNMLPMLAVLLMVFTMVLVLRKFAVVEIWNSTEIVFKGLAMPRRGIFVNILQPVYDLTVISGSFFLSIILFEDFGNEKTFLYRTIVSALLLIVTMFFSKSYRVYWLRAGTPDYLQLAYTITSGFVIILILNTFLNYYYAAPWSLIVLLPAYLLTLVLILGERIHLRYLQLNLPRYYRSSEFNKNSIPVVLYGASAQLPAYQSISNYYWHVRNENVLGIIDNDIALQGMNVYGYKILGDIDSLENVYAKNKFEKIIVITPNPTVTNYGKLKDFCNKNSVELSFFTITENSEPSVLREDPPEVEEE